MFYLWRNQVVGFCWQNVWKTTMEEWHCASKNQLPGFYISGILVKNGLILIVYQYRKTQVLIHTCNSRKVEINCSTTAGSQVCTADWNHYVLKTKSVISKNSGKGKSSLPEVLLRKDVLKICSQLTGEEIKLRHGCSPVKFLHIFRTPLPKNIYGGLLLERK